MVAIANGRRVFGAKSLHISLGSNGQRACVRSVLTFQKPEPAFHEKNQRQNRSMIVIELAIAAAIWTPLTVFACKCIADA